MATAAIMIRSVTFFLACVSLSRSDLLIDIDADTTYTGAGTDDGFAAAVRPVSQLPFFERYAETIHVSHRIVIPNNLNVDFAYYIFWYS